MKVRRAVTGDEVTLRSLRLQALTDQPDAFGSTHQRELARTTPDWFRWIDPGPSFILEVTEGEASGIVAGSHDGADASTVQLLAMWVHPLARRTGAADLLVEAVLEWARSELADTATLWVTEGNWSAIRLYQRNGFTLTGQHQRRERDARSELEMSRVL